jgi:hypothetical protein
VVSDLWIGKAVVALTPMEAWVAGRLTVLHALKERQKRAVYTEYDILQDLGVDFAVFRHGLLDTGKLSPLLVVGDRDTTLPPRFLTLLNSSVIDVAAKHQHTPKVSLLLRGGLSLYLYVLRTLCCSM